MTGVWKMGIGNIRIELVRDTSNGIVWIYASFPSALRIDETKRFVRAMQDTIVAAEIWQQGERSITVKIEPKAKTRGRPKKTNEQEQEPESSESAAVAG